MAALITGGYTQTSSGELDILLDGPMPQGSIGVLSSGPTTLGGTLSVSLASGFWPYIGEVFDIINAQSSLTGRFAALDLPGGDRMFTLSYTPTGVVLTAIPEPASAALVGGGAMVLLLRRKRG